MNKKQFKQFQKLNNKIWGKDKFFEEEEFNRKFNERLNPFEQEKYKKLHNLYNLWLSKKRKSSFKPF